MKLMRNAAAIVLVSAMLPGAAAAQDREQLQILAELRMIQEQSGQLRALIATLEDTLKALNGKLDQQADANRKTAADQKLQIDGLRDTVGVLREKLDDTNVRISTLSHEVETLRGTFANIQQAQQTAAAPVTQPAGDPAATPPGDPAAPPPNPPAAAPDAKRLFDTAMADYFTSQYDLAISGFQAYLRAYPTAPNAAQAQYYIGESHYQRKEFQEAITAYGRVVETYKNTAWVPEAIFKQGQSYEALKDIPRARQAYELLVKNYPETENAVVLARQRLQALPR